MITAPSQCMLVVFHQTLLFSTLPHVSIVLLNARRTGELFEFDWTNWYNDYFSYVRNVEYGKYHEPIYRTLQKFSLSTGKQGEILPLSISNLLTGLHFVHLGKNQFAKKNSQNFVTELSKTQSSGQYCLNFTHWN